MPRACGNLPRVGRFGLVRTRDGALALKDEQAGEVMHPGLGPSQEAERLYVQGSGLPGRLSRCGPPLVLFDVGLGAGSNASRALATHASLERPRALEIVSFENDLGAFAFALEHPEAFALPEGARVLLGGGAYEAPGVRWSVRCGDALALLATETRRAELVFWDPFSQAANPGLWTVAAFRAARAASADGAVLVTYSTSTTARSALLLAGWWVGEGPVLERGRRTTVAANGPGSIVPLRRDWLGKRARSTAPWPVDAPGNGAELIALHPQFSSSS